MGVRVKLDARMAELPFARGGAVFSYCRLSIALRITTSNPHISLAREELSPLFPLWGASSCYHAATRTPRTRSTIAQSKLSDSCGRGI